MLRSLTLWAVVGLTVFTALAGCADSGSKKANDGPTFDGLDLTPTETTGVLRGVVYDDGIRPLGGVLIGILGPGGAKFNSTTSDSGIFGFSKLQPGTYFITASKIGFTDQQSSGDVVAGLKDPPIVKVLLVADPAQGPFIQSNHMEGFISCSVRGMIIAYQCGTSSLGDVVNANYDLPKVPHFIQSEMTWKSTQAFGDELSLAIRCLSNSPRCPNGQLTIVRSEGKSPQIAQINHSEAQRWALGDGDRLQLSLFAFGRSDLDFYNETVVDEAQRPYTGKPCLDWNGVVFPAGTCVRATGPGIIINQKVDVYTNSFFGFTPPEGWAFIRDGLPKLPAQ